MAGWTCPDNDVNIWEGRLRAKDPIDEQDLVTKKYFNNNSLSLNANNTQVIFNDAGTLAGDTQFTWNKTDNELSIGTSFAQAPETLNIGGNVLISGSMQLGIDFLDTVDPAVSAITIGGASDGLLRVQDGAGVNKFLFDSRVGESSQMINPGNFLFDNSSEGAYTFTLLSGGLITFSQVGTDGIRFTSDGAFHFEDGSGIYFDIASGFVRGVNSIATQGYGTPTIYKVGRATAQTAANTNVASFTVGTSDDLDGSFEVSANVLVTTSTTHNFTVTVDYTDEGNTARTTTLNFTPLAGGTVTAIANAAGAVPYAGIPIHIRCKKATAITIKTAGTFTTVTYNVEGIIKQIA